MPTRSAHHAEAAWWARTRALALCAFSGSLVALDWENSGPADPGQELGVVAYEFGLGDARRVRELYDAYLAAGADLVDINFGCPVRKVTKTGAGATLASMAVASSCPTVIGICS